MKKLTFLSAIIAALSLLSPLSADNTMNLYGLNSTYLTAEPIVLNHVANTVYSGGIQGNLNGGLSTFFFCFDLNHDITIPGSYNVSIVNPNSSLPSYLMLSSPFNLEVAASLVNNANVGSFGTNTTQYAALQLAIWSILYNWTTTYHPTTTLGSTTNNDPFTSSVTGAVLTDALNDLAIANGFVVNNTYGSSYGNYSLFLNTSDSYSPGSVTQTLLGLGLGVGAPEPGTYLLLGGFLVIGLLAFQRRQLVVSK